MSQVEVALFLPYAGGIVAGIFAYYAQSKSERFVERLLSFSELVSDLMEELAKAPISEGRLNLPYLAMLEAAGKNFLNLSVAARRRADNAFRAKVLKGHRAGEAEEEPREHGPRTGCLSRRRLQDLAKAYERELGEPVLARGLGGQTQENKLSGTLGELLPTSLGERGPDVAERQGLLEALFGPKNRRCGRRTAGPRLVSRMGATRLRSVG